MNILPNLLLVDDSADNLDLLDALIQKRKIKANVIRANSGHMAIEKIREIDLALAILDVEMPGMNGYELALKINEVRINDRVPIIFLTAKYLSRADISKGYDSGAVDYILKPFNDRILISKINIFLDLFNYKQEILRDAALLKQSSLELFNVTVEVEERERNRFAGELHDGLGPLLSTIKLYFQWLAETDDPVKKKLITEKGNNNIEKAIQTTREVAQGLSSVILSKYGYVDAVLSFIETINDMQKLSINLNFNTKTRFNTLREAALYRITTELINNTLKYAKATHVNISYFYSQEKNRISFTYTDDGIGFDLALVEKSKDSLGLLNIQQRIMLIRGVITIKTAPGKGLEIYVEMPLG